MSRDCPDCGDPLVETTDGDYTCIQCGWSGDAEDAPEPTGSPLDVDADPETVRMHVPDRRRHMDTFPFALSPDGARRLAEALEVAADDAERRAENSGEPRTDGGLESSSLTYTLSEGDAEDELDELTPEYIEQFDDLNPRLELESVTFRAMTDGEDDIPVPEFPEDADDAEDGEPRTDGGVAMPDGHRITAKTRGEAELETLPDPDDPYPTLDWNHKGSSTHHYQCSCGEPLDDSAESVRNHLIDVGAYDGEIATDGGRDEQIPATLRDGAQANVHETEVCDGAGSDDCVRDDAELSRGEDEIHVTNYGPGHSKSGRRVLCGECREKQRALDIAASPQLAGLYDPDELETLREKFPDILADTELPLTDGGVEVDGEAWDAVPDDERERFEKRQEMFTCPDCGAVADGRISLNTDTTVTTLSKPWLDIHTVDAEDGDDTAYYLHVREDDVDRGRALRALLESTEDDEPDAEENPREDPRPDAHDDRADLDAYHRQKARQGRDPHTPRSDGAGQTEHSVEGVGEDTRVFCPDDGRELGPGGDTDRMEFCPYCGSDTAEDGHDADAVDGEVFCPNSTMSTYRYCPGCGASIDDYPTGGRQAGEDVDLPDSHPLAGREDLLDTHAGHLQAYSDVLDDADPDDVPAVMVVLASGDAVDTLPTARADVDREDHARELLASHIQHVAQLTGEDPVDTARQSIERLYASDPTVYDTRPDGGENSGEKIREELGLETDFPEPRNPWLRKAKENREKWGQQDADALTLAMMEELGEFATDLLIAREYAEQDRRAEEGRDLLRRIRDLGDDVQDYLESVSEDANGDTIPMDERPNYLAGAPSEGAHSYHERSARDELDDVMALGYQMLWALEAAENGGDDGE